MKKVVVSRVVITAAAGKAEEPGLERDIGELGGKIGIFRAAAAVALLAVARLRHEVGKHAVERDVVVILLPRQQLDALDVLGGDVVAQLDDDATVFGVDQKRVLRIGTRGKLLRAGGRPPDQRGKKCKQADHGASRGQRPDLPANVAFRRTATGAGTNGDTSPPMDAICRTSVALIGRTIGEVGTETGYA